MRTFLRFLLKSREGLRSYLVFISVIMAALFAAHLFTLFAVLIPEQYDDYLDIMIYELFGTAAAAYGLSRWTDSVLHYSVAGSISRRTFLKGMAIALPGAAAVTALLMQAVYMITDGIYVMNGNRLGSFATASVVVFLNDYPPTLHFRLITANLTIWFCALLLAFSIGLIFVGARRRFNLPTAFAAAGGLAFLYRILLLSPYDIILYGNDYTWHYCTSIAEYSIELIGSWIDPAGFIEMQKYNYPDAILTAQDTFWSGIAAMIALTLICFFIVYAVFILMVKKAPVRGKEQEGEI